MKRIAVEKEPKRFNTTASRDHWTPKKQWIRTSVYSLYLRNCNCPKDLRYMVSRWVNCKMLQQRNCPQAFSMREYRAHVFPITIIVITGHFFII